MRTHGWIAALAALALIGSPAAFAKGKGNPPGHAEGKGKKEHGPPAHSNAGGNFSSNDREIFHSFFVAHPNYRGSPLPPGIAKNYARGKPLPPGIAKKVVPYDLLQRLPERPGYTYYIVDDDVVLVAIATGVVADILVDVFV
jgi:Ni/Co efflux regulator RcnB